MPRRYKVTFENITVSAPQDLVQITGVAGKTIRVLRCWTSNTSAPLSAGQMLSCRQRLLPVTVTNGSGGTAGVIAKTDQGDAAATFSALVNSTTKATTTGTAVIQDEDAAHIYAGYDKAAMSPPTVAVGQAFVFELLSTPGAAIALSGGVEVEEIG